MAAGGDLVAAGWNCSYLVQWAASAKTPGRRLGASALALVNSGLALEALLFLWLAEPASAGPAWRMAAVVLVRLALLASAGLVAALLLRDAARR